MSDKMQDMGVQSESTSEPVAVSSKSRMIYPSISLSSKNIGGLEGLKIGDTVSLEVRAKVTVVQSGDTWGSKKGVRVDFDLLKGCIEQEEPKDMEDATNKSMKMLNGGKK